MLWYIDNPSVFEKDKRKDTLGICPKEHATEWDMEVFWCDTPEGIPAHFLTPNSRISNGATSKFPQTGKCKVMVTSCSEMYLLPSG